MHSNKVFVAFFTSKQYGWGSGFWSGGLCDAKKRNSRMRLGSYDLSTDSVLFYTESTEFGKGSSLLLTPMATNPIWAAGVLTSTCINTPTWRMVLIQLNEATGKPVRTFRFGSIKSSYETDNNG